MEFKILSVLFFLFVLMPFASASVMINEILPNPVSDWNNNGQNETYDDEWIELYNSESSDINLSGWILGDKVKNYTLDDDVSICANCFLILYGSNTSLQLNNGNEEIYLYNNSILIDYYNYSSSSQDLTFGRCPDGNDSWQQNLNPTPGASNNCSQPQEKKLELNYQSEVQCNENFTITINAYDFDDGAYDVKIDIKDVATDNRVGKVWNGTKWLSTYSYVNSAIDVINGNGSTSLVFKVENFDGEAIMLPKVRKTGTSSIEEFQEHYINIQCNQSNKEESEIQIVDAPGKAKFGETIEVELDIYKGDTSKYAVYIYVEDENGNKVSDKITLHFKTKFSNQTVEVELSLKCKNETGYYDIVAEGLGTEDREEIELSACSSASSNNSNDSITIGDFSYGLTIPNAINLDEEFVVKLKISSEADQEQNFLVWSYVYRGPKCYSCSGNETRESNAKELIVKAKLSAQVILTNVVNVNDAEPGLYKLKIKVLQEGLKTPKEFTYDLKIEEGKKASSESDPTEQSNSQSNKQSGQQPDYITGSAIIESKSFLVNKTLSYVLATLCMLLVIYIIIKKI